MNEGQKEIIPATEKVGERNTPRLTLRKGEKLRHRSLIDPLFRTGNTIYEYPLRLTWRMLGREELESTFRDHVPERIGSLQMLVTVPKKKRRHAVDRVLMRRRIREAYRLNRLPLKKLVEQNEDSRTLGMAFIYLHDANLPYSTIENKMKQLLRRLGAKLKR
ncbi:MAG: hypothetical protein HDS48_06575 [Bacteroides sp.]|nr:hypothetical protein [Bacteroides sp.]